MVGSGLDEGVTQGPLIDEAAVAKVERHSGTPPRKARPSLKAGDGTGRRPLFQPDVLTDESPR